MIKRLIAGMYRRKAADDDKWVKSISQQITASHAIGLHVHPQLVHDRAVYKARRDRYNHRAQCWEAS